MRRAAIGLALLGALLMALPAAAQTGEIRIFSDITLIGKPPGSIHLVHTETVDESLIGASCTGFAATENNASEWANNDLIIASGGNTAVIPDFEAVSGGTTFLAGTLTLGPTIDISIRLGRGGVTSGGTLIVLNCAQPEVTTTVIVDPTTTTEPTTTTTAAVTTTTQQTETEEGETPVGGPTAGGGSTAGGNGLGLLTLALGATAILGAGALAMMSRSRGEE
jgi:hypothetical protein